jgi:hypothetical protein
VSAAAVIGMLGPWLNTAGRWLIRRLVQWGVPRLIAFIECRVDVLADRRKHLAKRKAGKGTAARKLRLRWLAYRVRWRVRLVEWLKKNHAKLGAKIVKAANDMFYEQTQRIPWDAAAERFAGWRRRHAA